MEFQTKNGIVKVYAKTIEEDAISQILRMANSPLGQNADIRIMPDCHAGAGCVIGTTMRITDRVCPNLVGVDIGCGVTLVKTDMDFGGNLDRLDAVIRRYIPYGFGTHPVQQKGFDFTQLRCWKKLKKETQQLAWHALGSLGGGNHFIEAYDGGYIAVHSGSRNIGYAVADYYQAVAIAEVRKSNDALARAKMQQVDPQQRQEWLKNNKAGGVKVEDALCYLTGASLQDYLFDIDIMQKFAHSNRARMLDIICARMGCGILSTINSTHNYIDVEHMILRKGAISAQNGEELVIPLNMRDGLLVCRGKGNDDWNYSAPHGAGRLYSRSSAKKKFSVQQYKQSMQGIYTTCVGESTLDEAPFVYKDWQEIMQCIEPTVDILDRLIPIYNFKAN